MNERGSVEGSGRGRELETNERDRENIERRYGDEMQIVRTRVRERDGERER